MESLLRVHQEQASVEATALDTKKGSVMSAVMSCTCFAVQSRVLLDI